MEGSIYTVDDVSDLLGIPRPTLYRYLREYSIPHLRQGGRIRIPEDSFDRIREARDLHKEGLGTETVRRQLREGGGPDTGELDRRLNKLHDTLENLRGDLRAKPATTGEVALSPVLQTILARQSLMLSAMFNLTGMVEDLLLNNGKGRKRPVARAEEGLMHTVPLRAEGRGQISGTVVAEPVAVREAEAPVVTSPTRHLSTNKFGSLGRRRRGALAALSALLLGLLLLLFLPTLNEDETAASKDPAPNDAGQQEPPEGRPTGAGSDAADREGGADQDNVAEADAAPPKVETTSEEESAEDTGDTTDSSGGIPDVSSRPLEEAARILSEAGYNVAAIKSVQGPEEYGTVTGTEPSAGTEARSNAPVVLTMSSGPTGASPASASSASASASSASSTSASAASTSSAGASSASASAPPSP